MTDNIDHSKLPLEAQVVTMLGALLFMKRKSKMSISATNTLWFIVKAVRAAGGNASNSGLNDAVKTYEQNLNAEIGISLVANQLGIFATGEHTFEAFYSNFRDKMEQVLTAVNWIGKKDGEIPDNVDAMNKCLDAWQSISQLGNMAEDLIKAFDGKVEFEPPHPIF